MKKFTSLFALLSCLCVVSAQAEATVTSLKFANSLNWGEQVELTSIGDNQWTFNWDLSGTTDEIQFKFIVNNLIDWLGYTDGVYVKAPDVWVVGVSGSGSDNFQLNNSKTGFKTYKITATWAPSDNVYTGWTIKVEGVQTRHTYTVAGTGALFNVDWAPTDSYFDMPLGPDGSHFIFNKVVELNGTEFAFKVVMDNDWNAGSFPEGEGNNYVVNSSFPNYGGAGLYEVKISYYPPYLSDGISCELINLNNTGLTIVDGEPFLAADNYTVSSALYIRELGNNLWGTLCLPFRYNVSEQSNVTFYYLGEYGIDASNRSITFTPAEENSYVAAGDAMLFKLSPEANGILEITASGEVPVVSEPAQGDAAGMMVGTFTQVKIEDHVVYYISGDDFYYGTRITINPYRAWLEGETPHDDGTGAPFRFSVDDAAGLQFVEQENGTVKAYYDLQGRKLDSARKGLVIENGKIIMVK